MVELGGGYVGVAKALGVCAERVQRPEETRPALDRAMRATREGKPAILEFMTRQLELQPRLHLPPGTF
jgi:thiamine pyrophosphate-dependent acetolactate synthase large subunit-like protein